MATINDLIYESVTAPGTINDKLAVILKSANLQRETTQLVDQIDDEDIASDLYEEVETLRSGGA